MTKTLNGSSLLLALLALAPAAQANPLTLKVGDATVAGAVGFTLMTTSTGESLRVDLALGPAMASDKAIELANAVVVQDTTGTWSAAAVGAELTFQHLMVDGVWYPVDSITNISDTTGGGTVLETSGAVVDFNLGIDPSAVASGVNASGHPSYITVSITATLAWTYAIQPGDTPQHILDLLQAFLVGQATAGVTVSRPSPTTIGIQLSYNISTLNWTLTDTGLQAAATGGGAIPPAGVIDR
jgi:hypothetical protein